MLLPVKPQYDVGVIVGRFQVHDLHDGHADLINTVCESHDKVLIFLGLSPLMNTIDDPLDFEARKQMIQASFPEITVLYVKDMPDDKVWSRRLDEQIKDTCSAGQSVVLYGGRGSFIGRYHGDFATQELVGENESAFSGTETRRKIAKGSPKSSADWRAGAVWASASRFPTAYQTVDICIEDPEVHRWLLARKPNERLFRFVGGFSDPASDSLEADAAREVREETGLEVGPMTYVGSTKIDDWRYRGKQDCIKTALFVCDYIFGAPKAMDDIAELRWFDTEKLKDTDLVPEHRPLLALMQEYRGI